MQMELTQKETQVIERIRQLQSENQFSDFYMILHYEPIGSEGGGFVQQIVTVEPNNLTALRSKFYEVASDLKSVYVSSQTLFLFVFDGFSMRLFKN